MAGDYLPMRTDLWDDPRVVRMASLLNVNRAAVVGGCWRTWSLGNVYTTDGRLAGYTGETLDAQVGIPGWSEALAAVGWLSIEPDAVVIPDFEAWNSEGAKRRLKDRDRKRSVRDLSASKADKKRTRGEGEEEDRTEQGEERRASDLDGASCLLEEKRREVLQLLTRITERVRCRHGGDWSLVGKVALLVAVGKFSQDDLEQALEAVTLKGKDNPAAYFHKCMENKAANFGGNFKAMLAGVKIPDWLPIPRGK